MDANTLLIVAASFGYTFICLGVFLWYLHKSEREIHKYE